MQPLIPLASWVNAHPWLSRLTYLLSGIVMVLSFAPFGYFWLAPLLLLPLLLAFQQLSPRDAAWLGASFGAGLFLAGTYWLYISIHVFGQAPLILALLLMVCLVLIMAVYYAATGWIIARYRGTGAWQFMLLAPAVWVVLEWLRGWILSGFPWMTLGYSQIDSPLAGIAPVLGIYGVSLGVLVSSSALVVATLVAGHKRMLFVTVAIIPWLAGGVLERLQWTQVSGAPITATIVQGGVSQDRKWLAAQFESTLTLYRDSIGANRDSHLLIWPEVAIPAVLDQAEPYVTALENDLAGGEQTLLFGILERDLRAEKVFNSVVAIGGSERQIYRKRHLVPFGEYFPVPAFVREWMRLLNLPYSDISPGDAVQPLLKMADGNLLSVAICYEDAYAAEQLYALPAANVLINVSNDAWFGDSIAPHQHLQIARMRALEAGRSVIRATNNGISAFIGPAGELIEVGPQFEFASMTHAISPRRGETPYARVGNWPVILLTLLLIVWAVWRSGKTSFSID